MKYLYTKAEGMMWEVGELDCDYLVVPETQFHSVLLPNDQRWDAVNGWQQMAPGWFKDTMEAVEIYEKDLEKYRAHVKHCQSDMPKMLTQQEIEEDAARSELLKLTIVELSKDKRTELYRWMHDTFDHCRIYER